MAFVNVPKDLTAVKNKVAFGLTKRQLVCFGAAAAVGAPIYFLTHKALGNSFSVTLMIGVMLPFFLVAMYEKDGRHLETIVRNFIRARFIVPRVRPYKTQNLYAYLEKTYNENSENKEVERKNGNLKSNNGGKYGRNGNNGGKENNP